MSEAAVTASCRSTFVSQTASLSAARDFVTRSLTDAGADSLLTQAELVASELASNAVENGSGKTFLVLVRFDEAGDVAISVRNDTRATSKLPDRADWGPAHPLADRGRGLGIVEHLASAVDIEEARDHVTVTAHLAAGGAATR